MARKSGSTGTAKGKSRQNAETMAARQREISVSEFFAKNRHLLGFDNPRKALLTTVKEAVDNSLDACEEAGILPEIDVIIEHLPKIDEGRYRVTITDNGPGIVRKQVENIFGRLLYGSKFHRLKMSRGQQGIGISAAGMYGLMTTGRPMVITTRPKKSKPAHHLELAMDTTKNRPEVTIDVETDDFPVTSTGTGTRVTIELEAKYVRGKASVDAYLEQTAIANPHAKLSFTPPAKAEDEDAGADQRTLEDTEEAQKTRLKSEAALTETTEVDGRTVFPRTVDELPDETVEIKPHPYGVELGTFLQKLKGTDASQLAGFFKDEFCRVTPAAIAEITKKASIKGQSLSGSTWVKTIETPAAERLYRSLQQAKLRSPPTDCLSPIGVRQMLAGLLKGVKAEFYAASTRSPAVYRGNPFQIEAAIAFGGDLPADQPARVIRFANRVPLLYQQSACSAFKSVVEAGWKNYGLQQPRGSAPVGPLVVMIHMASVWVPFTSESKEAIADYDEIRKEMKLALQECGRKLNTFIRRRQKMKREGERRDVFERYIGEIAKSCEALTGTAATEVYDALKRQAARRTEMADAILNEDGKVVGFKGERAAERMEKDDGVLIVSREHSDASAPPSTDDDGSTAASVTEPKPAPKPAPNTTKSKRVTKKTVKKKVLKKVKKKTSKRRTEDSGLFAG
ncbi:MAG: DNA topoisomerase VI subunit B [Planctomycetota bacterium]